MAVNWAQEHAAAVLEAWYPGEEGGTAIAETLAGINNPGGRLPVTFYASLDQLPPFEDYSMQNRTYRYFQGKPLYGFGYGLSYSTFEYSNLRLSSAQLKAGDPLTVQGGRPQHLQDRAAMRWRNFTWSSHPLPGAPARALRGFTRVHLAPGETRHVSFTLKPRDLSMVNEQRVNTSWRRANTPSSWVAPNRRRQQKASGRSWRLRGNRICQDSCEPRGAESCTTPCAGRSMSEQISRRHFLRNLWRG